MLRLPTPLRVDIERHGRETYPRECCGFLVGKPGHPRVATRLHRCVNLRGQDARQRFEIDPLEWVRAERMVASDEQVIGIYHSHPDSTARPSEHDREQAHPNLSYVIVAVCDGRVDAMRSWELDPQTRVFDEEWVEAS